MYEQMSLMWRSSCKWIKNIQLSQIHKYINLSMFFFTESKLYSATSQCYQIQITFINQFSLV